MTIPPSLIARTANLNRPPPRPQTDREFLLWLASPEPARAAAVLARAVHEQERASDAWDGGDA